MAKYLVVLSMHCNALIAMINESNWSTTTHFYPIWPSTALFHIIVQLFFSFLNDHKIDRICMPAALVHYYHKKKKLHASCIFHCYQEHKICPDVLRDRVSVQIFCNFWSMIMKTIEFTHHLYFIVFKIYVVIKSRKKVSFH